MTFIAIILYLSYFINNFLIESTFWLKTKNSMTAKNMIKTQYPTVTADSLGTM